ncbi:MAG: DUF6134 family protein [Gammaproteobacteria bacterium]
MPASTGAICNTGIRRLCVLVLLVPLAASAGTAKEWRFRVFLDEREIGYHHFHLIQHGPETELLARAEFDVTFLRIPLFSYRHENSEVWIGQCLQNISAITVENGERFRVEGTANGGGFRLSTPNGEQTLPACVSSFAYWNRAFLENDRLLNPQTGEYLDVETRYLGEQTIRVGDTDRAARHYRLTTGETGIDLWYSREGQWLALESTTRGGRLLHYRIE